MSRSARRLASSVPTQTFDWQAARNPVEAQPVPLVFAAAGRIGDHPGRSIAGVAGIAYGSGLIAPGVIGGIAHLSSLTVSFSLIVGLTVLMGAGAPVLRPKNHGAGAAVSSHPRT